MRTFFGRAITAPIARVRGHLDAMTDSDLDELAAVLDHMRRAVGNRRCVRALERRRLAGHGRRS